MAENFPEPTTALGESLTFYEIPDILLARTVTNWPLPVQCSLPPCTAFSKRCLKITMKSKIQTLYKVIRGEKPEGRNELGDFTSTPRLIWIAILALPIGYVSAWLAMFLLKLINLFTNLFFYQRWSFDAASPANNHLGVGAVLVPVVGALIIGLMARFGSERIRGHGIPEAIEAILITVAAWNRR